MYVTDFKIKNQQDRAVRTQRNYLKGWGRGEKTSLPES